jgi:hypothetical protein
MSNKNEEYSLDRLQEFRIDRRLVFGELARFQRSIRQAPDRDTRELIARELAGIVEVVVLTMHQLGPHEAGVVRTCRLILDNLFHCQLIQTDYYESEIQEGARLDQRQWVWANNIVSGKDFIENECSLAQPAPGQADDMMTKGCNSELAARDLLDGLGGNDGKQ